MTNTLIMDKEYYCPNCFRRSIRVMGVKLCSCDLTRTTQSENVNSVPESFSNQIVNSNTICKRSNQKANSNKISVEFSQTTQSKNETSVQESLARQNVKGKRVCKGLHSNPGDVAVGRSNENRDLPPASMKKKHTAKTPEEVFETLTKMCDGLKLSTTIRDRANENYRKLIGKKASKGRKHNVILGACIDIACEQEGDKRTLKEICSISVGITMREIVRAKMGIKEEYEQMGEKIEMKPVSAAQCMRRYCSRLRMKEKATRAAEEAIERAEEIIWGRTHLTVAGVVISMVTQLSHKKELPLKDIARAVNASHATIARAYKEIYPYASRLIPTWFASEEDLLKLTPCISSDDSQTLASLTLNS